MCDFWNQKDLPPPPTARYKATTANLDLDKFRRAIQKTINFFNDQHFFVQETALLTKIVNRMKLQFRQSKDFKTLDKLKHSLTIYFETNLVKYLRDFFSLIPKTYTPHTYIPTRNMLCYILARIQGFVKLMERIYETCHIAAEQLKARLSIGHFCKILIIMLAVVSRIFSLTKFCARSLCEIYGKLLPYLGRVETSGKRWLPLNYVFPSDLREWLNVDWIYEDDFIDLTLEPKQTVYDMFNFIVDDDDDDGDNDDDVLFSNEYILIQDDDEDTAIMNDFNKLPNLKDIIEKQPNEESKIIVSDNSSFDGCIEVEDIGEEIVQEEINRPEWNREVSKENRNVVTIPDSPRKKLKRKQSRSDSVVVIEDNDDDDVQILGESQIKRKRRKKSESKDFKFSKESNFKKLKTKGKKTKKKKEKNKNLIKIL